MSSSISSSSQRPLYGIMIALLVMLAALELITRFVLFRMSDDIDRFQAYPERVEALANKHGVRLVLIGNSATEQSIDTQLLSSEMEALSGKQTHATLLVADSSEIVTWQAIANQCIWRGSARPDTIVLTFFGTNLQDTADVELGRIAQFFSTYQDWPELFATQVKSVGTRAEFILDSFWGTFAFRDRIKQRILATVVPDYRNYATTLNQMSRRYTGNGSEKLVKNQPTYRGLTDFLTRARSENVEVILVAFPALGRTAATDPKIAELASANGALLLDMQGVAPLKPEHYVDSIHLTEAGKQFYTPHFARELHRLKVGRNTGMTGNRDSAQ